MLTLSATLAVLREDLKQTLRPWIYLSLAEKIRSGRWSSPSGCWGPVKSPYSTIPTVECRRSRPLNFERS